MIPFIYWKEKKRGLSILERGEGSRRKQRGASRLRLLKLSRKHGVKAVDLEKLGAKLIFSLFATGNKFPTCPIPGKAAKAMWRNLRCSVQKIKL